jgi:hypothetical protein
MLVALLLLVPAAPRIAAQIVGDTWTSPTYGFSVSWAGTEWQPDPASTLTAVGSERLDRLHLINGTSSLYFEGATRYHGDLSACVGEEANRLSQESGVSDIRPYRDENGAPLVANGPNGAAAAFTLKLTSGSQEIDLVDYVECRSLIPDKAVLIITLVTEPGDFKTQMATAQQVIDTIALGAATEATTDPLAAYGGWLAAAQQQPSIAGPLSGALTFGPGMLGVARAGVDASDVYARAEFANPEPSLATWDIGIGFRDSGGEEQFRLVVDSTGTWFFKNGSGPVITGGTVVDFDTGPAGSNSIEIVAVGDTGYFAFNDRLVTTLDLSARPDSGDVFVAAGFFSEDATQQATTAYRGFEIWSLAGLTPGVQAAPPIAIDAAAFATLVQASTATSPLAGSLSGQLPQTIGAAAISPAGVAVEDFVARAAFVNPSDAASQPWDFGIAFREQANGDHYRLTVASDGTWEFQIGLQADLSGGSVPSLSFEEGAVNILEIVALGDSAGFAVNGVFVSTLDISELKGTGDVWVGAGVHQANAADGAVTAFQDFTVWPVAVAAVTVPAATPVAAGGATPVASAGAAGEQVAMRVAERGDSGIDALAVLNGNAERTTIIVTARDATGSEVVVVEDGTCEETETVPAFLLNDLDATGRSETTVEASLAELTDGSHALALHRSGDAYQDVVACGDIPPQP